MEPWVRGCDGGDTGSRVRPEHKKSVDACPKMGDMPAAYAWSAEDAPRAQPREYLPRRAGGGPGLGASLEWIVSWSTGLRATLGSA